jgi:predicted TIM-barrel fold metal-dependent hydrolase
MDAAVQEARWGRERGLRGVLLPADDPHMPPYWDQYWEPLWSVCEDLALPVHFHAGSYHSQDFGIPAGNDDIRSQVLMVEATFWNTRHLKFLIYGGVMERHPNLSFVFTETMGDWVPHTLARMELVHRDKSFRSVAPIELPHSPSEYWYRQCYVGASLMSRDEVLLRDQIGIDNMMFGLDYPHPEGTWLRTTEWLEQVFGSTGITTAELRKILGGNAVRVYDLDINQLAPIAERVGPLPDDILNATPRALEEWGSTFAYSPSPYRKATWSMSEPAWV